jgi:glycosyltransferase involved in cell wall biosynthesis
MTLKSTSALGETGDVVFTCPKLPYEFDERRYRTEGMGGSETALFEIARELKAKTRRSIKVFKSGKSELGESGVEYFSLGEQDQYFSKSTPAVHIAWRHNVRLTYAKTYLWSHDYYVDGLDAQRNFDLMLCLSQFQKIFAHRNQFVPSRKIIVTRNGINPRKFRFDKPPKNKNKIVWMTSPDRGLKTALLVMDVLVKRFTQLTLHVYYGFHLLYLYGLTQEADDLKVMLATRPYVIFHGFVEQNRMYREMADAVIWLYPCTFSETFCITALEMLALGVFPITSRRGALPETLGEAERKGRAILLGDSGAEDGRIQAYADAIASALKGELWANVSLDLESHSWSSVADEWLSFMHLG